MFLSFMQKLVWPVVLVVKINVDFLSVLNELTDECKKAYPKLLIRNQLYDKSTLNLVHFLSLITL